MPIGLVKNGTNFWKIKASFGNKKYPPAKITIKKIISKKIL